MKIHVFVKPHDHEGSQQYFDLMIKMLTTSKMAAEADYTWDKLLRDGLGDDSKFPRVKDFIANLVHVPTIEDLRFYCNKDIWNLLISLWVTEGHEENEFYQCFDVFLATAVRAYLDGILYELSAII